MDRGFVLALLSVAALNTVASAQQPVSDLTMTPERIGPVLAGITEAKLKSLGLPIKRGTVNLEGDTFVTYEISVGEEASVTVTLDAAGKAFNLGTKSRVFVTSAGAHVGATLAELKKRYPKGQVLKTFEEGRQLSFFLKKPGDEAHGSIAVFEFDASDLSNDCLTEDKGCPDLSERVSKEYRITSW